MPFLAASSTTTGSGPWTRTPLAFAPRAAILASVAQYSLLSAFVLLRASTSACSGFFRYSIYRPMDVHRLPGVLNR